jgi:metal-dependent HD superfamily phosphatase/phosphodiesterase
MGALTRMMGKLTAVNAPETLNTNISTIGMKTSAKAMKVLSDSGGQSATTLLGTVRHLDGRKMDQNAQRSVSRNMAAITAEAEILEELSPIVSEAAKAWEKGVKAKTKALQVVATASQNVAVLNAEAQTGMLVDHITAGNKISAAQERSQAWAGV